MPYTDFHTHTEASIDSQMAPDSLCAAACAKGDVALAITDHMDMLLTCGYDAEKSVLIRQDTLARTQKYAAAMKRQYEGKLRVASGIELGDAIFNLPESEQVLDTHTFDVVLGSLHMLDEGIDFYEFDFRANGVERTLDRYFDAVLALCEWGRFHALAHLAYPLRYIPADLLPADLSRWMPAIEKILVTLIRQDIALEINTSGLRNIAGTTYPPKPVVQRYRELGGRRITFGSDAHRIDDVSAGIPQAVAMAKAIGFTAQTVFFGGVAEEIPLD